MAIPKGTLLAILITGVVYMGVAISAGELSRIACCFGYYCMVVAFFCIDCIVFD